MTQPRIEPQSSGPLANILANEPVSIIIIIINYRHRYHMMVISVAIGILGTIPKGLVKRPEDK